MLKYQIMLALVVLLAPNRGPGGDSAGGKTGNDGDPEKKVGVVALLGLDPGSLSALTRFVEKKEYKGGIAYFESLGQAERTDPRLRFLHARLLIGSGKFDRGYPILRDLAKQYPCMKARAIYEAGAKFYEAGEAGDAIGYFQQAIEEDPFYAEPYLAMALITDDKKRASAYCEQAMALSEPTSDLYLRCRKRLDELGDPSKKGK